MLNVIKTKGVKIRAIKGESRFIILGLFRTQCVLSTGMAAAPITITFWEYQSPIHTPINSKSPMVTKLSSPPA